MGMQGWGKVVGGWLQGILPRIMGKAIFVHTLSHNGGKFTVVQQQVDSKIGSHQLQQ